MNSNKSDSETEQKGFRKKSVRGGTVCSVCNIKFKICKDKILECERCNDSFCVICLEKKVLLNFK